MPADFFTTGLENKKLNSVASKIIYCPVLKWIKQSSIIQKCLNNGLRKYYTSDKTKYTKFVCRVNTTAH